MRIVSWNCNGAFRKKYKLLEKYAADLLVIQECENPALIQHTDYQTFASHTLWKGRGNGRGLGIFSLNNNYIEDNQWDSYGLDVYISFRVNSTFNMLGIWACDNYIQDFYVYCRFYFEEFKNMILCGDLNSNVRWDKKNRQRTHSATIALLEKADLVSCYHHITGELQGSETTPTFCMYRNFNIPYHIDYAFAPKHYIRDLTIGEAKEWLAYSDHMPIILDVSI